MLKTKSMNREKNWGGQGRPAQAWGQLKADAEIEALRKKKKKTRRDGIQCPRKREGKNSAIGLGAKKGR